MKYSLIFLAILICFGCKPNQSLPEKIELNTNWQFKKVKESNWNPASVPGNVHSDLLENKLVDHPFIGDNENKLQWISETDWEYKTTFEVTDKTLKKKHIELNFEGLDTYSSVYLNDSLILSTNNAFRSFSVDVKQILKQKNELKILFNKTSTQEELEKNKLSYSLPEGNRIFTRKAQFQYGWDWGPKLNTCGIWKPINLVAWDNFKIEDAHVKLDELSDSLANFTADIQVNSSLDEKLYFKVFVNNSLKAVHGVRPEKTEHSIQFDIQNPKLWWPHNIGEPYLYDIKILATQGELILDSFFLKKGVRNIKLRTEKDSIGESFYFEVNGVPVYAKGANYIPQNSMQNKVTNDHYENLLSDVVEANMNMLRVWGGGIYENDIFYELCDKKGILIWQDFMFACAMYPGDSNFLQNVSIEAKQQVKRLRNHASIALWCGNNENSEGWHRWGWQAGKSEAEKEEIWNNYLALFGSILPKTVSQYSQISYWESSPKYGRGNPKYKTEGDAHDWWIWHDAYPFEHLEENVPRFMSEFGFQSFPSFEAINYINQSDSIDISSKKFKSHQKHSRGFQLIEEYMKRDFPVPENPEYYVYVSQLLQAYGITKGIEAHRRAKPYNMGTLYWQLNDCWPVVSWSSIDHFGNWKALHYHAKHAFDNLLISGYLKNDTLNIYLVNDEPKTHTEELNIEIMDFNGNIKHKISKTISTPENSSEIYYQLPVNSLNINREEVMIRGSFKNKSSLFYLVKPKNLKLRQSYIEQNISKTKSGFSISLSSQTLQKNIFLHSNIKGHFSDNYFDLLPGEIKKIQFKTKSKSLDDLKIKTLNQLINL